MSVLQLEQDLQQMAGGGQLLEAFDKFYADEVVMHEGNGDVFEGKAANRKRQEQFLAMIKEVHGGGIGALTANEETGQTATETWIDVTFMDGNRIKMEQVSVKQWKNNLVVHERFYYNMPTPG